VKEPPPELRRLARLCVRAFYPSKPVMIVLLDTIVKHSCVSGDDLRGTDGIMELEPAAVAEALQTLRKEKLIKKTMLVDPSQNLDANRRVEFWYMDYRTVRPTGCWSSQRKRMPRVQHRAILSGVLRPFAFLTPSHPFSLSHPLQARQCDSLQGAHGPRGAAKRGQRGALACVPARPFSFPSRANLLSQPPFALSSQARTSCNYECPKCHEQYTDMDMTTTLIIIGHDAW
jgi:transcription initiation factor IIE alpha subunit